MTQVRPNSTMRSERGETLVETLFAILVASLSLLMLAGTLASSLSLIETSRRLLEEYHAANESVVRARAGTEGAIAIETRSGATTHTIATIDVEFFENTTLGDTPVVSYKKSAAGGGS